MIYGNSVRRKPNSFYLADLLSDRALEHIADQMSQASVTGTFELRKRATHIPELVNCNLPNGPNCPLGRVATAVAIFLHPGLPQLIIAVISEASADAQAVRIELILCITSGACRRAELNG